MIFFFLVVKVFKDMFSILDLRKAFDGISYLPRFKKNIYIFGGRGSCLFSKRCETSEACIEPDLALFECFEKSKKNVSMHLATSRTSAPLVKVN